MHLVEDGKLVTASLLVQVYLARRMQAGLAGRLEALEIARLILAECRVPLVRARDPLSLVVESDELFDFFLTEALAAQRLQSLTLFAPLSAFKSRWRNFL